MTTVSIVATPNALKRYFPDAEHCSRMMSAPFPVNPNLCKTVTGRWLAQTILTTRRDDDFSLLQVEMPVTDAGAMLTNLGLDVSGRAEYDKTSGYIYRGYLLTRKSDLDQAIAKITVELEKIKKHAHVFGDSFFKMRRPHYEWPVFGSAKAEGHRVTTPEQFFDFCAEDLRSMGARILSAGGLSGGAVPPENVNTWLQGGSPYARPRIFHKAPR